MKKLLFTICTLSAVAAYAQTDDTPPPMVDLRPQAARNQDVAAKPMNIAGTKVSLTPPAGMKPSSTFTGLQSDNAMIQVMDLNGGDYYKNGATFSKEKFEAKGAKVFEYKETIVDGYPAKFVYMQGNPDAVSYALIFGDSTFSVMLMAMVKKDMAAEGEAIKKCILAATYNKATTIDPFATAPFKIVGTSRFKFARYAASMYMFNYSGDAEKQDEENNPIALLIALPFDNSSTPAAIADQMLAGLKNNGISNIKISTKSLASINGYKAYELEATGESDGKKQLIYQVVLAQGDKCVSITGTNSKNFEADTKELKKFARTIRFK